MVLLPTLFVILLIIYPSFELLVQDVLGWRTYTLTLFSTWLVLFLVVWCSLPLPSSILMVGFVYLVRRFAVNLLFPVHAILEWRKLSWQRRRSVGASGIRRCFGSYFRVHDNLETLPRTPYIIVVNYPHDKWEHLALFMLPQRFAFVIKQTRVNTQVGIAKRVPCIAVPREGGQSFDHIQSQVQRHLASGRHIVAYINSESSLHPRHFDRSRTGILRIAQNLNVPVIPLVIDQIVTESDGAIQEQPFHVWLGQPFHIRDVERDVLTLRRYFTQQIQRFHSKKKLF